MRAKDQLRGLATEPVVPAPSCERRMRGDRASGLVMCQRGGINTFSSSGVIFPSLEPISAMSRLSAPCHRYPVQFHRPSPAQFLHAAGRHMLREKRILVITVQATTLMPVSRITSSINCACAPYNGWSSQSHYARPGPSGVHFLANERILIKAAVHVVFKPERSICRCSWARV